MSSETKSKSRNFNMLQRMKFWVMVGGLMASMLARYSNNPSFNPVEAYSFYVQCCLKRTKISKKEAGWPI